MPVSLVILALLLDQPLWLVAMADRQDLEYRALAESGIGQVLGRATIATIRCDPAALDLLKGASDAERRHPLYQVLRQRADSLSAAAESSTSGESDTMAGQMGTLNPFNENGVLSSDVWGYRRYPIGWPAVTEGLPSPMEGLAHWTYSARNAAQSAQLEGRLTLCR
jgi:hypothetical protein